MLYQKRYFISRATAAGPCVPDSIPEGALMLAWDLPGRGSGCGQSASRSKGGDA